MALASASTRSSCTSVPVGACAQTRVVLKPSFSGVERSASVPDRSGHQGVNPPMSPESNPRRCAQEDDARI
eukprot:scaffold3900_cov258-Pinguiococcus_pyrenoidosus.AAC.7